ncbi:sugar ABC transporter ATP-binding protein [Aeromicrobium ginsengisoli]|uniref:sugar ABC transporter ATP-binding protein n=1 Tax=Aeromicrobium ginsengisoli TaxID=363867 RepID=UPI00165F10F7|nr:sugar ABC transporter ATP-binding protein [Aeromicrobium ginsengisoli]
MTVEPGTPAPGVPGGGPRPPRLDAQNLQKSFGDFQAVDDVTLTLEAGEIHGFCGPNGAGKSTVVKMLSGQLAPDAGQIAIDGGTADLSTPYAAQQAGIAIVDQELSVVPALTVGENLALGATSRPRGRAATRAWRAEARQHLADVGLANLDLSTPVERLTLGERQLVEIARALGRRASLMILDEPTATLSDVEIDRVFTAIRKVAAAGRTVVFVSHRLGEVLALCDRVTVIRDGKVIATTAAADLTVSQLVEQMIGRSVAAHQRISRDAADGVPAIEIRGLQVAGSLHPFDLVARPGTVHALAGQVGSGAETVIRAIAGLEPTARGAVAVQGRRVRLGDAAVSVRAGIGYVSGDRKTEGLFLRRSVADNITATRLRDVSGRHGFLSRRRAGKLAAGVARKAGVLDRHLAAPVASLSGGNQQKVSIARALDREDVRVVVLDEPTRGVDVAGRAVIHDLLRGLADDGMAVIYSSTDLDELVDLPDTVITFWGGREVGRHATPVSSQTVLGEITHQKGSAS